jgi:hypothetical protein
LTGLGFEGSRHCYGNVRDLLHLEEEKVGAVRRSEVGIGQTVRAVREWERSDGQKLGAVRRSEVAIGQPVRSWERSDGQKLGAVRRWERSAGSGHTVGAVRR